MASKLRQSVAPLYLLLCLVIGGSAQGSWGNAILQLIGLAIIAWAVAAPPNEPLSRPARQLLWLLIAALAVVALQLVPLPASLWPQMGGRQAIAEGYRILGLDIPARPLSLAPHMGMATVLAIIPAVALFAAISGLKAYRRSWLVAALLTGVFGGILLGMLQLSSADPRSSPWYLYPQSSFGSAAGFFANSNNMAMLLVVTVPFIAALVASARGTGVQRYSAMVALGAGAVLVMLVGIALSQSIAGIGLLVPVLAVSMLLVIRPGPGLKRIVMIAAAGLLVAAVAALLLSPVGDRAFGTSQSVQSRSEILATTAKPLVDFLPFGSGLGTFADVYRLYEDPARVVQVRINHAHNDYAELVLELGVPGLVLIFMFLAWWGMAGWRAWRYSDAGTYARAASIATAALLAHSLVEFPLRTAALSACFAMCLALLCERRSPRVERDELRPTRHVVLR